MSFPTDYLKDDGYVGTANAERAAEIRDWLASHGLVATRLCDPLEGLVARVRIDVFGKSASEIEATLLEYASRCDSASERGEVTYGQCVIERNLDEQWGESYSWKGRLVLEPNNGVLPVSRRAAAAIAE